MLSSKKKRIEKEVILGDVTIAVLLFTFSIAYFFPQKQLTQRLKNTKLFILYLNTRVTFSPFDEPNKTETLKTINCKTVGPKIHYEQKETKRES